MPKTHNPRKPVHSFRLSAEGTGQLKELAHNMGRSESNVIEIALDRMYREELRYWGSMVRENTAHDSMYFLADQEEEE